MTFIFSMASRIIKHQSKKNSKIHTVTFLNKNTPAPEHDIRNIKIIPCENHRNEFSCKTFFNVFATNQKIPVEQVSTEQNDAFRFDLTNLDCDFINFQVSVCRPKAIYPNDYLKMYFNCWTLCQKSGFSDKKQNMCLRTKLTGPNVDDFVITKTINVQQNPGRGAKVRHN